MNNIEISKRILHHGLDMRQNKARYTAAEVTCRWAGAMIKMLPKHWGTSSNAKTPINLEKAKCFRPTDQPTDKEG